MVDFIFNLIFWVLAIYGLIEIIKTVYYTIYYTKLKSDGIYFIIATKNQEDKIEIFMRSILFKIIYDGKEDAIKNFIVTDLGSKDKTKQILEKMQQDYKFIKLTDWKKCKEIIDNIEKINWVCFSFTDLFTDKFICDIK